MNSFIFSISIKKKKKKKKIWMSLFILCVTSSGSSYIFQKENLIVYPKNEEDTGKKDLRMLVSQ